MLSPIAKANIIMPESIAALLKITVPCVIAILCAVIALFVLKKIFTRIKGKAKQSSGLKFTYAKVIEGVVKFVILFCTVIVILQFCGINVTSVVTGLGIAGAVIGLALQDLLKDVIMGAYIISDNFFAIGDGVVFDGEEGIITEFSPKTTKIEMLKDGRTITVCNREIQKITKLSNELIIDVPMPYNIDYKDAYGALLAIADDIKNCDIISDCKLLGTQAFNSSSIAYRLSVICECRQRENATRLTNIAIQDGLKKAGIAIPFNQLDVHIDQIGGKTARYL
ncbi:MAG: mechanosensitive ion channel family protein [Clostridia bacterium]|nr:mechanosensitive ion channel family protein [Clostridia bacterium]